MNPRERDLEEEIRSHLRMAAQERMRSGDSPQHAALAARREFGNTTLIRETAREVWRRPWLDHLMQDMRFAARTFARTPGVTAIIILTLALGIGANTAVFSIFDAVLLHDLPYRNPDRLVSVLDREIRAGGRAIFFDLYSDYENWKEHSRQFEGFAAATWAGGIDKTWTGQGAARSIPALPVTADYFEVLGVAAAAGRTFEPADNGRGCAVVLSWNFWQSAFGGQKRVIGSALRLDQQDCRVLGVMPASFASYPNPDSVIWTLLPPPPRPDQFGVFVIGRLRPGVSMDAGFAEVRALARGLHATDRWGKQMEPGIYGLQEEFTWLAGHNLRITLITLLAAVGVVQLICCVNVSNLLLGRALARQREMAVRAALGSGRARLLRQLLTESLVLSVVAALLGTSLATGAVHLFRLANPIELPPATRVEVNGPVLAFTLLLSVATSILFGLFPAWRASRTELSESLKAGSRASTQGPDRHAFGRALVGVEMALTILLLAAAGLLIGSVRKFENSPVGFRTDRIATVQIKLPNAYADATRRRQVWERIVNALRMLPETETFALSTAPPTQGTGAVSVLEVAGHPAPAPDSALDTGHLSITSDYFSVLGIPLRRGRFFEPRDRKDAEPVAIINEQAAAKYFPGEYPIGRSVREFDLTAREKPWIRIVGVVGNEKRIPANQEMNWVEQPIIYYAWQQSSPNTATALIRARDGAQPGADSIQRAVAAVDPDAVAGSVELLGNKFAKLIAYPRFRAGLLAAFAGLALLLAMVGLYGVLAHLVTLRMNEIGVRMALGATPRTVLGGVVMDGLRPVLGGIAAGLTACLGFTRLLTAMLYGFAPQDPAILLLVTTALLIAALIATWFPALRATGVDPVIALRYE